MDYILSFPQQYLYTGLIVLFLIIITCTITLAGPTEVLRHYKSGKALRYGGNLSDAPVKIPKYYKSKKQEMRGVWVATINNIDSSFAVQI